MQPFSQRSNDSLLRLVWITAGKGSISREPPKLKKVFSSRLRLLRPYPRGLLRNRLPWEDRISLLKGNSQLRVSGRLQHLPPLQRRLQTSNVRLNSQLRAEQTRQARRLRKHSRICNSILLRQRREKTISLQRALLAEGHRERYTGPHHSRPTQL